MSQVLKLSISLMTSNRKDTIKKCLDSLQHLRDTVPSELVIVDTGCDEEMLEIIQLYADRIVKFAWCNDFAAARNAGIKACSGNWYMFLDDDEWFEDTTAIEEFFLKGDCNHYGEASYIVRNYGKPDGSVYQDGFVKRIIRLDEKTHFKGRIHESLLPNYEEKTVLKSFVHHYGYAFPDQEANVRHSYRNIIPLREGLIDEPENNHWRVQLALEYIAVREYHALQELCVEGIVRLQNTDSWSDNIYRGSYYGGELLALFAMAFYEDAAEHCDAYLSDKRNTKLAQLYLFYWKAMIAGQRNDVDGVLQGTANYQQLLAEFDADPDSFWKDDMIIVRNAVDDNYRERMEQLRQLAEDGNLESEENSEEAADWYNRMLSYEEALQTDSDNLELCLGLAECYYHCGENGKLEALAEKWLNKVTDELRQLFICYYVDAIFSECRYDKMMEAIELYGGDAAMSDVSLGLLFCEGCISVHRMQRQNEAFVYGKAYLERFVRYHEMAEDMPAVIGAAYRLNTYELVREILK